MVGEPVPYWFSPGSLCQSCHASDGCDSREYNIKNRLSQGVLENHTLQKMILEAAFFFTGIITTIIYLFSLYFRGNYFDGLEMVSNVFFFSCMCTLAG
ncbi:hypothetical protein L873DRAFT_280403 [Choiromyces venosus 120613-1]|uniref:Uncharacterized protein n=1 Tax=Choiromyces venosus 120613-1 TaxID=1336337 RepID=A0A3N4K1B1_9PEZI|nr:hypothetical protein L873DRAFT_280403 [Choiromyces venosus 120613-1]